MKSFLKLISNCSHLHHIYHLLIFICGAVKIFKLQIFAEFSVRVPDRQMEVILKVNLDFSQYCEIRVCSESQRNGLRFENIGNNWKSFDFRKLEQKVLSQKFLYAFPIIFSKKFFLAKTAWLDTPKVFSAKNNIFEVLEGKPQQ